mmetsp:Transcript_41642/g.111650  ORF Transcript_41642/g.111650 Transcript_41642/m.111650 type:complete len:92 (-) Transcript_41642:744-1019(-)
MEIGDAVKRAEAAFDDADKEHSGSLDCKKLHSVVQSLLANGNLRHELFGQYSVYQVGKKIVLFDTPFNEGLVKGICEFHSNVASCKQGFEG